MFLVGGFLWVSTCDENTQYLPIVGQMVSIGIGMGLTSAPATEAIMGVVPAAKAGVGSAVNDATRELGGTLGVAVIGSVALSAYRSSLDDTVTNPAALEPARESVGAAFAVAARTGDPSIVVDAQQAWIDGLQIGCWVAAGVCLIGAVLAAVWLPAHPVVPAEPEPASPAAPEPALLVLPEPELVCSECGSPIGRPPGRQALFDSAQASSKISASNLV
jgi:hypothetical protein